MNSKERRTIAGELESVTLGGPAHFGGLTVFPLFRDRLVSEEPDYILLEDAVAAGMARVTELGQDGSVSELRCENLGDRPVLLLDGVELAGAKQNRVVNLTILAPPKQDIVIPVSCVEAGRWHRESVELRPAAHVLYARARAAKTAQVSCCMATRDTRQSNQPAMWEEIAVKSARLRAFSPTGAMDAMYDSHTVSLEAYLRAFAWKERQAGVLFAIGPDSMAIDLLDHAGTMRRMFPKLLRGFALDALEAPQSPAVTSAEAAAFLARIATTAQLIRPAVGLGEDVRLTGPGASGAALWAGQRYVHLCAFTNGTAAEGR